MFKSYLLIASASIAKKEALAKKYNVSLEFVEDCAEADPTPNGVFTEWIVKSYKSFYSETGWEDPGEVTEPLRIFMRLKNSPVWSRNNSTDINSYSSRDIINLGEEYSIEDLSNKEQRREMQRKRDYFIESGAEFLGDIDPSLWLYRANNAYGAMALSEGTSWCTKGHGHSCNYTSKGDLYTVVKHDEHVKPYVQLIVPQDDVSKLEFENSEGHDLYSDLYSGRVKVINYPYWSIIEHISNLNSRLKKWMEERLVINSEMEPPSFPTCAECGKEIIDDEDEESFVYEGLTFCDVICFRAFYEENNKEEVTRLLSESGNYDSKEATDYLMDLAYSTPTTEAGELLSRIVEAGKRKMIVPDTEDPDRPYSLKWIWSNVETGANRGEEEKLLGLTGLSKEVWERVYHELQPKYLEATSLDRVVKEAMKIVQSEFSPLDTDIKEILEGNGYL